MLTLQLNKESDNNVLYNYYPENKEEFGTVLIDKTTGEITTGISGNDKFGRYLMHAVKRVKEYFEKGTYQKEDIVAWY